MKKNFVVFCLGFLLFASLCFATFFFFSDSYIRNQVEFSDYDVLGKGLTQAELLQVKEVHGDCFSEERKRKLRKFYLRNQEVGAHFDKRAFESRLENYLEESRAEKMSYVKSMENVTVARYRGKIIGLYLCSPEDRIIENTSMIWNFCLAKNMRGKGISHRMIDHAIKRCSLLADNLALMVYKDSLVAQSLYKKHGFQFVKPRYSLEDEYEYYDKFLMKYEPNFQGPAP